MNKITEDEREKINALISNWFKEGKMSILPRLDVYGEEPQSELEVILYFPAG